MSTSLDRVDAQETASTHEQDATPDNANETWVKRVRQMVYKTPAEREAALAERLSQLNAAIQAHPDEVSNYVMRGEVFLKRRQYELAASDFRRSLKLAQLQIREEDWGLVAQVLQDRARIGLRKAEAHL